MAHQLKTLLANLISDTDVVSSTRFASLVALIISSWVIVYATLNFEQAVTAELFLYYIVTFAAQYGVGKTISAFKKEKPIEDTDDRSQS